jgi:hypothetical protein
MAPRHRSVRPSNRQELSHRARYPRDRKWETASRVCPPNPPSSRRRPERPETLAEGRRRADTCRVRRLIAALVAALASTAIFVVVRNDLDLEDSRFIYAMLAFSTLAFALSAASCLILASSMRSSVGLGVVAFLSVPLLYVAYLALFVVAVCLIGSETCYS